jgi:Protein of Unknown function (DUF2784)
MWWYQFLNYFFFFFHTSLILFNTFGWIFRKTRKWNLITLFATAFSWFVLGIWYGWGYCFCTDWHWRVREHLGYNDNTNSYTQFLARKFTGIEFNPNLVDTITAVVFFASLILSIVLNVLDWRRKSLLR